MRESEGPGAVLGGGTGFASVVLRSLASSPTDGAHFPSRSLGGLLARAGAGRAGGLGRGVLRGRWPDSVLASSSSSLHQPAVSGSAAGPLPPHPTPAAARSGARVTVGAEQPGAELPPGTAVAGDIAATSAAPSLLPLGSSRPLLSCLPLSGLPHPPPPPSLFPSHVLRHPPSSVPLSPSPLLCL